ncbi:hypothetical protein L2729_06075 [Shewanella gelidimarina]|uniref:hypothetical protein n=1 Tax=Shewanella gelidimarina TaxID=56813 RepID=UPI00200D16DB|nr:hypothetical protein [Shewanella gelidimarina]MCL1057565.1 hypothetical protein [Shewanella gelidimarina]
MIANQTMPYTHEDLVEELTHLQSNKPMLVSSGSAVKNRTLQQIGTASNTFYSHALTGGNGTMFIAVIGLLLCILVGYSYADSFSLWAQVASHIGLILFATAIKIGYVMRCVGLDGMGHMQL